MSEIITLEVEYNLPNPPFTNTAVNGSSNRSDILWYYSGMNSTSMYNKIDFALIDAGFGNNYTSDVLDYIVKHQLIEDIREIAVMLKQFFAYKDLSLEVLSAEDEYLELWVDSIMTISEVADVYYRFLQEYWGQKSYSLNRLISISVLPL